MKKNITINKISGFTLVEMLVSLAIFLIVMAIVGGVYTTFVQKQRSQLGMQNVQQDVQNFFDTLEREIRTGYGETVDNGNPNKIIFVNQNKNETITYQNSNPGFIKRQVSNGGVVTEDLVTSSRTYIKDLKFQFLSKSDKTTDGSGYSYLTGVPTRVTVLVTACVDVDNVNCLSAQTTLSFRQLRPATL